VNFREACDLAGVSRQRLNAAIVSGRLPAARGGGPGKPTSIRLEDLQAWCTSEGLAIPLEALERSERSERSERLTPELRKQLAEIVEQAVEQGIGQAVERLERSLTQIIKQTLSRVPITPSPAVPHTKANGVKAEVLTRLRTLQAEGLSLQAIANRLNTDGVPTLSGKGRWQKGTIGHLLAQQRDEQT
jgi:hypothetical protein